MVKTIRIDDIVYEKLNEIKGNLSYSDLINQLLEYRKIHEIVKSEIDRLSQLIESRQVKGPSKTKQNSERKATDKQKALLKKLYPGITDEELNKLTFKQASEMIDQKLGKKDPFKSADEIKSN